MLLDLPLSPETEKSAKEFADVHYEGNVAAWIADLVLQATDYNAFNMKMGELDEESWKEVEGPEAG